MAQMAGHSCIGGKVQTVPSHEDESLRREAMTCVFAPSPRKREKREKRRRERGASKSKKCDRHLLLRPSTSPVVRERKREREGEGERGKVSE